MKIRSLLLGSVFVAGMATTGYAADLGVVTSLDVCDELGLSGLTISSDDNCLVITGGVSMSYSIGDYEGNSNNFLHFQRDHNDDDFNYANGGTDSDLDIDAWLKFVASAPSDFGPATATIKLLGDSWNGNGNLNVVVDEAWVGIGDTTVIMAGKKSSIFNKGDDAPLNYLGLFHSDDIDPGVGFRDGVGTGNAVIQVVSNLGNGLSIGGGIENLDSSANITAVGVLSYAGDGITAHISGAVDESSVWNVHAGFTGAWDPIKVVGAVAADSSGWWNVLGSVSATFDMFTLAASGEATSESEWGVGGSATATVSEGVTINLGGRYFDATGTIDGFSASQVEAGVSAAVTETITATAAVGYKSTTADGGYSVIYGKGGLAWAPGGGFTSSVEGYVDNFGSYKATFKAAKEIK
ncbi:MAG: hypothetical protein EOP22_00180 [Hyphomicrobiales bacterium]|nr:MAG: hypothetical protein EOP22_00180 [Hyphomicrobiales bacterium]